MKGTVLRLTGKGLVGKPAPKSAAGARVLELPSWTVTVLRRRLGANASWTVNHSQRAAPVFPAPLGGCGTQLKSYDRADLQRPAASMTSCV